jgi:uncharacterized protein
VGLKFQHAAQLLAELPDVGFLEVHAENYLLGGGAPHRQLTRLREHYALSIHGVGLSIGSERIDMQHLEKVAALLDRYQPKSFSEHLAWSSHGRAFYNDLLPLPYTRATLERVCEHIDLVQTTLRRRMLLENPSTYVEFESSTYAESDFIREVVQRTGCGLLLDVNNAYISCVNHGRDPHTYLRGLPLHAAGEIHLAGFTTDSDTTGAPLLIDTHGSKVDQAVWALFKHVLTLTGPLPTLIERDNDVPSLHALLEEARTADSLLAATHTRACA